jgi:hypothetical protein
MWQIIHALRIAGANDQIRVSQERGFQNREVFWKPNVIRIEWSDQVGIRMPHGKVSRGRCAAVRLLQQRKV